MAESTFPNKDTKSSTKVISLKDRINEKVEESGQEWAAECPLCGCTYWSILFDGPEGMAENIKGFKCAMDDCLYLAPVKINLEAVEIDIHAT